MLFSNASLTSALIRVLTCALLALLGACGGGGSGVVATVATAPPTLNILPPAPDVQNKLAIAVDAGPANTGYNVNRLYASVTVCFPGSTSQCQTIDHVLVDTGSTGLRLLASALAPGLSLNRTNSLSGRPLLGCMQFIDQSFAWGPIATADITLGGKTAASTPVQIIGDPVFSPLDGSCSTGSPLQTAQELGANGILGLSMQREDCGLACAIYPANGIYFTCADSACTAAIGTRATLAQQVAHPVPKFSTDNNGFLIDLPAVSTASASTLNGSLIFGIGTQTNNTPAPVTPVLTSLGGSTGLTTRFLERTFQTTYLDTGSNGIFFDSAGTLAACGTGITGFYCPPTLTTFTATLTGANGQTFTVGFSVANAAVLFATGQPVLPHLAGDLPDLTAFDFGLPFFYGRRVYFRIQDMFGDGAFVAFEASQN
jgi:hypothetical protein